MSAEQKVTPNATEILLEALKQAAEAHGVYEATRLGGVHDVNWPAWYAEHMSRQLASAGYEIVQSGKP